MATYTKYQCFVADIGLKKLNLNTDTLKIALTNTAPNVATHALLADITEISAGNGYSAGGAAVPASSYAQSGGVAKLAGSDVTFTASGGSIASFRYAVLYDDTATNDPLIAYWDRGSALTLNDGDAITIDFADNLVLFSLT